MCALSSMFIKHLSTRYQLEKNNSKGVDICSNRNHAILSILGRQVSDKHDTKSLTLSEKEGYHKGKN
jgi:hypothetical protein